MVPVTVSSDHIIIRRMSFLKAAGAQLQSIEVRQCHVERQTDAWAASSSKGINFVPLPSLRLGQTKANYSATSQAKAGDISYLYWILSWLCNILNRIAHRTTRLRLRLGQVATHHCCLS